MRLGEVGLMTGDVKRLADFYKWLLGIDNHSDDTAHQTLIEGETALTVTFDERGAALGRGSVCLAFTVDSVDAEHERLKARGVTILDEPQARPWGARNMRFLDPDGNEVYLRQFIS